MRYTKPPLTFDHQVALLESRGMQILDRERVRRYLSHINYYRLRAYWLPLEKPTSDSGHRFKEGTQFDDALNLYIFDRKFRLLVMEAIERVEVSFRTRLAYELSLKYGSHPHLKQAIFRSERTYDKCLQNLQEELGRSQEKFVKHYQETYSDPNSPPIWAICEVMSFGQLSHWFKNLKYRQDRKAISGAYDMDDRVLASFMHHLTHVRNLAAHHSRLWNRRLTITMQIPSRPTEVAGWFNGNAPRNVYNTLVMLGWMIRLASPGTTWAVRVRELIETTPQVKPVAMGFPDGWRSFGLWRNEG